jgi:hypothetical protein
MRHLAGLVLLLVLSGCGAAGAPVPRSPGPSAVTGTVTGTLIVTTTTRPGGPVFIEGALPEVRLRDGAGAVVGVELAPSHGPIAFRDLPAGHYTLEPALRPCDGNCGHLDGRTNGCRHPLEVTRDLTVRVVFRIGHGCTVT